MKIGIIGGGQLALMMIQESPQHQYFVLDPNQHCSVKNYATLITAPYDDQQALHQMGKICDVITYEFENISVASLAIVSSKLVPNSNLLYVSQNRLREKNLARDLSIPTPLYYPIETIDDLHRSLAILGGSGVLKTQEGGYDGKGQIVIKNFKIPQEAIVLIKQCKCILEEFVNFIYETSLIAVRDYNGHIVFYHPTINTHQCQILQMTSNLTKVAYKKKFKAMKILLTNLNVIGTVTIEFFATSFGFLFNEIAPRVHNSGHWTIEGTNCSQFKNHILAITNQNLIKPITKGSTVMINIIGQQYLKVKRLSLLPGAVYHDYFKNEVLPGRKMGHLTINDSDAKKVQAQADYFLKELK